MNLPAEFLCRMKKMLGESFRDFLAAADEKAVRGLHVNTLKMSPDKFESIANFRYDKIPYVYGGYTFDFDGIGRSPLHHSGAVYVQEPAAMAVVESIDIKSDFNILDMCAAPGGKSLQAAAKNTDGVIVSNEFVPGRAQILMQNIERLGARNSIVISCDSADVADFYPETFDITLVDAPCSGEGMMRKSEAAISDWSRENIALCAKRQRYILENAATTVKNGGYLLYSTCTYSLEENEMVVDGFLSLHPEFSLADIKPAVRAHSADGIEFEGCICGELCKCRRFYAGINAGEGQFVALMRKRVSEIAKDNVNDNAKKDVSGRGRTFCKVKSLSGSKRSEEEQNKGAAHDFICENIRDFDFERYNLVVRPDGIYISPNFRIPEAGVISYGVKLGEVRNGRIIPHHRFFMAFGTDFMRKIDLADTDTFDEKVAEKYIHGETVSFDGEDGFYAVMWHKATLGGGKVSGGVLKNYYPKGLRNP